MIDNRLEHVDNLLLPQLIIHFSLISYLVHMICSHGSSKTISLIGLI